MRLGNCDKYYRTLAYIISCRQNLWDRYWEWRKHDERSVEDLWAGLSHGEALLMQAALALFRGQGQVDISDMCNILDHDLFFVFLHAIHLYRNHR